MAAIALTPKTFNELHIVPADVGGFIKLTASDWIVLSGYKGVIPLAAYNNGAAANTVDEPVYGLGLINNTGTAYTATTTTLEVDGILPVATRALPYYIWMQDGEIIEVVGDSTPTIATSTLTVKRGCLGTTAGTTGVANNAYFAILNILVLAGAGIGPTILYCVPLPNESKAKLFA